MSSAKAKIPPKAHQPARPGKDTIYVDVEDEITAIIDKVEHAKEKIVALVLPKRATVLQSTVNMRLLKRTSEKADKNVVLITSDPALLPLAGLAGLHVAKNLQSKPAVPAAPGAKSAEAAAADEEAGDPDAEDVPTTLDYHRSIGELATAHIADEAETIDMDEEAPPAAKSKKTDRLKPKGLKIPDFDRFRLRLIIAAAAGVGLLIFLFLAIFVLPKATVTIKTTSLPVSADFELTTSESAQALDSAQKIIPAALKTSDQTVSQQVKATGQQNNGEKAKGSITMTAQRCAPNIGTPSDVPAGTGVSTNGLTFITQEKTTFSYDSASGSCVNYKSGSVKITAQAAGAKYNVSGASFSVQGYSASASGSASGGTDVIVTILSQADVDKVKQQITTESSDAFSQAFQADLEKQNLFVIDATLKVSDAKVTTSPAVGQPASTASATVVVTYSVLTVSKDDLKKAVSDELNKNIDKTKQRLSADDVLKDITVDVGSQKSPTEVTLEIQQTTTAVPIIDVAAVKKQAAGQKTSTIKASISVIPGVEEVDVKMSPFWVSKAPKAGKITIIEQQIKAEPPSDNP